MTINRLRLGRLFPLIAAVTLCAFTGCASTTTINTVPPGAAVTANGVRVGTTPYTLTDTKIVGSSTQFHLDLPGYQPVDTIISRSEEVDVLPLIAGIFLLIPLLWVMKYQATHVYTLQPLGAAPGGYAPPPAGYAPPPAGYPPPPAGYPPAQP